MGNRLEGKRVIVTGAASGIGRSSVLRFADEGARVLAADVAEPGLLETQRMAAERGRSVLAVTADAGREHDVSALVSRACAEWGGLDVFFANAGITGASWLVDDTSVEQAEEVLRVNLLGPLLAIKLAARVMREQGKGSIVCTASVAGLLANAGPVAYSMSKAGVVNLVRTAACELRGSGVRVNALCPGLIETGMTKPLFDYARAKGKESKLGQLNPLLRAAQPEEVAAAALFLASDDASYVNGHALVVDGGLTSSVPFVPPR